MSFSSPIFWAFSGTGGQRVDGLCLRVFSIAYGVIAGIISYILLNGIPWLIRKISNDRILPANYGSAESWVIPPGGIVPIWMKTVHARITGRDEVQHHEHAMEQRGGDE